MGIQGLLPFVKHACRPARLGEFRGRVVGVDAMCLMHKGGFGCADKLAKGESTQFYVGFVVKCIRAILSHGVARVIVVFDGASLPAKHETDTERRVRRKALKEKGRRLLQEDRADEALDCFKQSVEVTKEMIGEVMAACRKLNSVDCIVAPYESDAQLAYFSATHIVDVVVTEDSDLITFGCDQVFFKLDVNGNGVLYERAKLAACFGAAATTKFTFEMFRRICILAGCDYCASLPGIGLAKAKKFFLKTINTDLNIILPKVPIYLQLNRVVVDRAYIERFVAAENTFLYQLVFDPVTRTLRPLHDYPPGFSAADFAYCGKMVSSSAAYQLALGNVNPYTHKQVANYRPQAISDVTKAPVCGDAHSIWHEDYAAARSSSASSLAVSTGAPLGALASTSTAMLGARLSGSFRSTGVMAPKRAKPSSSASGTDVAQKVMKLKGSVETDLIASYLSASSASASSSSPSARVDGVGSVRRVDSFTASSSDYFSRRATAADAFSASSSAFFEGSSSLNDDDDVVAADSSSSALMSMLESYLPEESSSSTSLVDAGGSALPTIGAFSPTRSHCSSLTLPPRSPLKGANADVTCSTTTTSCSAKSPSRTLLSPTTLKGCASNLNTSKHFASPSVLAKSTRPAMENVAESPVSSSTTNVNPFRTVCARDASSKPFFRASDQSKH